VIVKFAITIKDNEPPPPVTGLELYNMKHVEDNVIVMFDESSMNDVKVPDVASYNIYLGDNEQAFSRDMRAIRSLPYITLDLKNTGATKIKDIDMLQDPECGVTNNQYCTFNYAYIDASGAQKKEPLEANKLYYLEDKKKYLYIIDGKNSYYRMSSGVDKYIAVTAIDTDGNEINNVDPDQKIEIGKNLDKIKVMDEREPGFVSISVLRDVLNINNIIVSFNRPKYFIDGTSMDSESLAYNIYGGWDCNDAAVPEFCAVQVPYTIIMSKTTLSDQDNMQLVDNGLTRVGVISERNVNGALLSYMYAFTKAAP
jgi:hypothetical protein